ncbi:MAG: hypothetical protein KGJ78_15335 [Alphaproteobacteria bacterium]|nr:hypothetical protein [Alphaproteobacteria bacterium]
MTSMEDDDICPKCGAAMRLEDKSTFTGRDMRTYVCDGCNESQVVDGGVALWQALSEAREDDERKRTQARHRKPTLGKLFEALRRSVMR